MRRLERAKRGGMNAYQLGILTIMSGKSQMICRFRFLFRR